MNNGLKYLLGGLLFCSITTHAALFDDNEARKKILAVEAKGQANFEAQQVTINELKKRIEALEAVIKGNGLQDMQNQVQQLEQQVAQLTGDLEVANHALEMAQQRQKDLYTDTDERLRKLESAGQTANTAQTPPPPPVVEEDVKAFTDAENLSKSGNHKEAFAAFDKFLKSFPNSKLVPDALYGMGYSQFALKSYKSSIATQQKVIDQHSDSAKAPDALYNMANSQIQLGQVANAKKSLRDLVAKYPNAEIVPSAQKRLKMLDTIK